MDAYKKGNLSKSLLVKQREGEDSGVFKTRLDYLNTFDSLYERQPELCKVLLVEFIDLPSIKIAAGELNLRYERNDPEAVKVCCFLVFVFFFFFFLFFSY